VSADVNRRAADGHVLAKPWIQLIVGVICMAAVANLQYGWTLFVNPIDAKYHWGRAAIQVAFTLFVLLETWLIPVEGYLVDRYGPRYVVMGGAALVTVSWIVNSVASSLGVLYLGAALGGIGTGCVYGTCVGNALKWFPGKRGLAAGITAAGFGAGAALTIGPIAALINSAGYEHAFFVFAFIQGAIVFALACAMRAAPAALQAARLNPEQTKRDYTPGEVLRSPVFYVLYLMFVLVASGGLTMAASMASIAKDLGIDKAPLRELGLAMPALVLALSLNRVCDGAGRPFFGWVSDIIGREATMAMAFLIGAGALFMLDTFGSDPLGFVLVTALYFGVYGQIFSLFPATQGDTFGAKFAAANAGMLYTAKGTGALLVPVAASIAKSQGWGMVFTIAMCFNLTAGLLAVFVLKPLRDRQFSQAASTFRRSAVG
jgi:OFA family oxalate/formate antiporter-like MFS transporter